MEWNLMGQVWTGKQGVIDFSLSLPKHSFFLLEWSGVTHLEMTYRNILKVHCPKISSSLSYFLTSFRSISTSVLSTLINICILMSNPNEIFVLCIDHIPRVANQYVKLTLFWLWGYSSWLIQVFGMDYFSFLEV